MSSPPFSPTVVLLIVTRAWEARYAATLKPLGLTERKHALLAHIKAQPGISFSELARRSRVTVQSAHTAVAGLARSGLVDDTTAHAGSASTLRVTQAGRTLLADIADAIERLDAEFSQRHPELTDGLRAEFERRAGNDSANLQID